MGEPSDDPLLPLVDCVARIAAEYPADWAWPGNVAESTVARYRGIAMMAITAVQDHMAAHRATLPMPQAVEILGVLSDRERDVALALLAGKRPNAIAEQLCISKHTVRNHMKQIFRKLDVHSMVELLAVIGGVRG